MVYRLIRLSVDRTGRVLRALANFLRGATGVFDQAPFASRESRSYLDRLEHKYSRPTRCC